MHLPKTVTAQDFIDNMANVEYNDANSDCVDWNKTRGNFDALLFRARQEARAEGRLEGLKEMYDAREAYDNLKHGLCAGGGQVGISSSAQRAYNSIVREFRGMNFQSVASLMQEARREALKEMDEAWRSLDVPKKLRDSFKAPVTDRLYSLRQEYQQDHSK